LASTTTFAMYLPEGFTDELVERAEKTAIKYVDELTFSTFARETGHVIRDLRTDYLADYQFFTPYALMVAETHRTHWDIRMRRPSPSSGPFHPLVSEPSISELVIYVTLGSKTPLSFQKTEFELLIPAFQRVIRPIEVRQHIEVEAPPGEPTLNDLRFILVVEYVFSLDHFPREEGKADYEIVAVVREQSDDGWRTVIKTAIDLSDID